ncbi:MAG TPA: alpha/beta hydrolase-fold protein [Azospirillaceae bacterium]|nr:alpha/beta hydrolase-fold protein [Azospirillaceae bacterium]
MPFWKPGLTALLLALSATGPADAAARAGRDDAPARLETAIPAPTLPALPPGTHPLALERGRDGLLYVPAGLDPTRPAPLLLLLHGAGGSGGRILPAVTAEADRLGLLVLAPDSREVTWDAIRGAAGPDIAFIDRALAWVTARFAIDPERQAMAGFSDGASYALMLGMANGDRFRHVLAWSPGFIPPGGRTVAGASFFLTHGNEDTVLDIDRCSRRILTELRRRGRDARLAEFQGGHVLKASLLAASLDWAFRPS